MNEWMDGWPVPPPGAVRSATLSPATKQASKPTIHSNNTTAENGLSLSLFLHSLLPHPFRARGPPPPTTNNLSNSIHCRHHQPHSLTHVSLRPLPKNSARSVALISHSLLPPSQQQQQTNQLLCSGPIDAQHQQQKHTQLTDDIRVFSAKNQTENTTKKQQAQRQQLQCCAFNCCWQIFVVLK